MLPSNLLYDGLFSFTSVHMKALIHKNLALFFFKCDFNCNQRSSKAFFIKLYNWYLAHT